MRLIELKNFSTKFFETFSKNINIEYYSRNNSLCAVFAERYNRSIRDLLKTVVFERIDANWIDVFPTFTRQYSNGIPSSNKLQPNEGSLKKNEGSAYNNSLDKGEKIKSKFEVNDLIRTADIKKTFSKSYTTNWSYELY